ncbi:MAG: hypothetical protein JO326_03250, partial [Acetobacteraceae bacterium]|nr:hypothetical protein [Acetobacteraceae bacterium]
MLPISRVAVLGAALLAAGAAALAPSPAKAWWVRGPVIYPAPVVIAPPVVVAPPPVVVVPRPRVYVPAPVVVYRRPWRPWYYRY